MHQKVCALHRNLYGASCRAGKTREFAHPRLPGFSPFWESLGNAEFPFTGPSAPSRFAASVACSAWLGSLGMARRSAWLWHWPRIWPFVLSRRSELGNGIARARHWLLAGTGLAIGWRSVRPRHGPRMAHGHGARPFKILQDTHRNHRACCLGRLLAPSQPLC